MRRAKATVRNSLLPSIDILSGKDAGRVQLVSSIDHREGKPQVEPRFYHNIYIYTYDSHRFIVMLPIKRSLGIPTFLTNCMALAVSSHILRPWKRTDWLVDHYCSGKACSSSHSLAGKKKYPIDPKFNMSSYKQLYFWGAILTPHIIGLTLAQIAHQSKHSAKKNTAFWDQQWPAAETLRFGGQPVVPFPAAWPPPNHPRCLSSLSSPGLEETNFAYTIHTSYYLCHVYIIYISVFRPVYMCIYIYTYIPTHTHTCMHACMHALHCIALHCTALHCIALHYITYIHTYVCVSHLCIYLYIWIYLYIYIFIFIYLYICIFIYLYIYISIYIYIYICACDFF